MSGPALYADRVRETTTTTGTGTVTLAGAVSGYQTFAAAFADGVRVVYCIESGSAWEVGEGVFTASGTTLSRILVLASSNSNALVSLTGTSTVFCDYPARKIADIGLAAAFAMAWVPQ